MSTSSAARGRSAKGQRLTSTMANGETSRNTTSKLNKNQQNSVQENQNATSNHHQSSPASSNRGNTNNGSTTTSTPTPDQKTSVNAGPGGRLRRRSAPPVTLESKNILQKFTDFPWNRFTLIYLWKRWFDGILSMRYAIFLWFHEMFCYLFKTNLKIIHCFNKYFPCKKDLSNIYFNKFCMIKSNEQKKLSENRFENGWEIVHFHFFGFKITTWKKVL